MQGLDCSSFHVSLVGSIGFERRLHSPMEMVSLPGPCLPPEVLRCAPVDSVSVNPGV